MTAAPPDPRGVAGLVGEMRLLASDLEAPILRSDLARFADRLEALAASPVSQPTVGGEVVAWRMWYAGKADATVCGSGLYANEKEARDLADNLIADYNCHAEVQPLYLHPASVEPVSQDAEAVAATGCDCKACVPADPTIALELALARTDTARRNAPAYTRPGMAGNEVTIYCRDYDTLRAALAAAARQEKGR